MTVQERQKIIEELDKECQELLIKKGADYSSQEDSLANFKRNAEKLGLTKYQILAVYMGKHLDSIFNALKASPENPDKGTQSEPLRTRIVDARNYLAILWAMVVEDHAIHSTGQCRPMVEL